jgi:hypothetical protein
MRTKILLLTLIFSVGLGAEIFAQDNGTVDYFTISGVVKNARSKKAVDNANISAVGTNIGTVTNEDGEFSLKINKSLNVDRIRISSIGYFNALINITKEDKSGLTFLITPESYQLSEVQVFSWQNPRDLVKAAIEKVEQNYEMQPNLLTGFYRETIQKRRKYIDISEAVIEMYKSPYNMEVNRDQVKVLKGRKLMSTKLSDTLSVKLLGGPNMSLFLDIVKNPDILLDPEMLNYYAYKMGEAVSIDDRLQFVVQFEPIMMTEYPLCFGTYYIDRETLAFTRAEFHMDVRDKQKVTQTILKLKPTGLRFTPEEVSYVVTYRQQGDKTYLNYVKNELRFKCDWKRRLFATNYTVLGETVITDRADRDVARFPMREAFHTNKSLGSEVQYYQDENFWSSYNIIEPTESLENAVNKLKKQALKVQ